MYADRPAETFFLFHRARRILFLMSQKENGGRILAGQAPWREPDSSAQWVPPSGSSLFPPDVVQYPHLSFRKERS